MLFNESSNNFTLQDIRFLYMSFASYYRSQLFKIIKKIFFFKTLTNSNAVIC